MIETFPCHVDGRRHLRRRWTQKLKPAMIIGEPRSENIKAECRRPFQLVIQADMTDTDCNSPVIYCRDLDGAKVPRSAL